MAAAQEEQYQLLVKQAAALIDGEDDWIANVANLSALLFSELANVNFAGVYRLKNNELILGPFQGKPACVHIALGKGVCGTTAQAEQTQIVKDVHQFSGHIACDSASNSEIVVPIFKAGKLWGVFDFDSTEFNNFDQLDQKYLEKIAQLIFAH
ncbi:MULTISPECIES: GAF domain-containing protein [Lactobacillus]|uniref:GAF domain-containing protein n=1 Tax=Lactobacillus xujianguonis TaxID=2495899 RepID=A0A437SUV7_9LACO|nr:MULTISPECIES: GAF domain-containing protein [Lactobacillus]RVU70723.1 GAF domain-containing protein [Lactobacillus xujianguonis]RVU77114.1 GAF domain-containing protein [Lactobacillus xujianguonis]